MCSRSVLYPSSLVVSTSQARVFIWIWFAQSTGLTQLGWLWRDRLGGLRLRQVRGEGVSLSPYGSLWSYPIHGPTSTDSHGLAQRFT